MLERLMVEAGELNFEVALKTRNSLILGHAQNAPPVECPGSLYNFCTAALLDSAFLGFV
jgi:hypothetical protein